MSTDIVFELSGYLTSWHNMAGHPDFCLRDTDRLCAAYAHDRIASRKRQKKSKEDSDESGGSLDSKTVEAIVEEKQKELVDTVKFTDNTIPGRYRCSMELMQESPPLFSRFKYPMYELSIRKSSITFYVTKVEKIVDGKVSAFVQECPHFYNHQYS